MKLGHFHIECTFTLTHFKGTTIVLITFIISMKMFLKQETVELAYAMDAVQQEEHGYI